MLYYHSCRFRYHSCRNPFPSKHFRYNVGNSKGLAGAAPGRVKVGETGKLRKGEVHRVERQA